MEGHQELPELQFGECSPCFGAMRPNRHLIIFTSFYPEASVLLSRLSAPPPWCSALCGWAGGHRGEQGALHLSWDSGGAQGEGLVTWTGQVGEAAYAWPGRRRGAFTLASPLWPPECAMPPPTPRTCPHCSLSLSPLTLSPFPPPLGGPSADPSTDNHSQCLSLSLPFRKLGEIRGQPGQVRDGHSVTDGKAHTRRAQPR